MSQIFINQLSNNTFIAPSKTRKYIFCRFTIITIDGRSSKKINLQFVRAIMLYSISQTDYYNLESKIQFLVTKTQTDILYRTKCIILGARIGLYQNSITSTMLKRNYKIGWQPGLLLCFQNLVIRKCQRFTMQADIFRPICSFLGG